MGNRRQWTRYLLFVLVITLPLGFRSLLHGRLAGHADGSVEGDTGCGGMPPESADGERTFGESQEALLSTTQKLIFGTPDEGAIIYNLGQKQELVWRYSMDEAYWPTVTPPVSIDALAGDSAWGPLIAHGNTVYYLRPDYKNGDGRPNTALNGDTWQTLPPVALTSIQLISGNPRLGAAVYGQGTYDTPKRIFCWAGSDWKLLAAPPFTVEHMAGNCRTGVIITGGTSHRQVAYASSNAAAFTTLPTPTWTIDGVAGENSYGPVIWGHDAQNVQHVARINDYSPMPSSWTELPLPTGQIEALSGNGHTGLLAIVGRKIWKLESLTSGGWKKSMYVFTQRGTSIKALPAGTPIGLRPHGRIRSDGSKDGNFVGSMHYDPDRYDRKLYINTTPTVGVDGDLFVEVDQLGDKTIAVRHRRGLHDDTIASYCFYTNDAVELNHDWLIDTQSYSVQDSNCEWSFGVSGDLLTISRGGAIRAHTDTDGVSYLMEASWKNEGAYNNYELWY